jgi:nucleoside-diphosphate-sugar epimerase
MNKIIKEDLEIIYNKYNINWEVFKNKTFLISGVYGMLPSYIVFFLDYLNSKGYNIKIIGIGRNIEKAKKVLGEILNNKNFVFMQVDICDFIKIDDQVNFIIHGASHASSQFFGTNPVGTLLPNVLGTYNLLEFARRQKISGFLFFSSSEIYGKKINQAPINENNYGIIDPLDIRNCYSESKKMGETICKSYFHQYSIPTKIVRIFHTYGPTMDIDNDKRVFSEFVFNVINNKDIIMKSDGSSVRSFCYIADAIAAYLKVLIDGENGEAYNVANSQSTISIMELAKTLVNIYPDKNLKVIYEQRDVDEKYIESKITYDKIDIKKVEELGWSPKFNISDGFKRTISAIEEMKEVR